MPWPNTYVAQDGVDHCQIELALKGCASLIMRSLAWFA